MKRALPAALYLVLSLFCGAAQDAPSQFPPAEREEPRLPDGRSRTLAILKVEHEKNLKDAAALVVLSQQLKADLEKEGQHVLSVNSMKKTEEIEKLSRRIRARLRSY